MNNAYTKNPVEVLKYFTVNELTGLSEAQVEDSRQKHGPNGVVASTAMEIDWLLTLR